MKRILIAIVLLVSIHTAKGQNVVVLDSTLVHVEVVIDSSIINGAWDIEWGPDDHLWIGDLEHIMRYNPVSTVLDTVFTKPTDNALGLAIHPNFPDTPYVFVVFDTADYYSYSSEANLFRYEWNGSNLINETLLLTYFHGGEHSGGRVIVTQDNKLLLTTADYWWTGDSLKGRVLRMNLDGSVPSDNPDPNQLEWTSGHRNPQGLTQTPNGNVYISEHGQSGNNELNLLVAGGHYGWPAYDGNDCIFPDSCNSSTYSYIPAISVTAPPPSGAEYYDHPAIPEFTNSILIGTLWGSMSLDAHTLNAAGDSVVQYRKYLNVPSYGRIRDMVSAPDGSVYFIGFDRQPPTAIYRVYNPNYIPAGIYSGETNMKLYVYPNPTTGELTLVLDNTYDDIIINVRNVSGKLISTQSYKSTKNITFEIKEARGVYIVEVSNQEGNSAKLRVLKQ